MGVEMKNLNNRQNKLPQIKRKDFQFVKNQKLVLNVKKKKKV